LLAKVLDALYGAALLFCPREFRRRFGAEMREIFSARVADAGNAGAWRLACGELFGVLLIAVRLRFGRSSAQQPAWLGLAATVAVMMLTVHEHRLQPQPSVLAVADSIDFTATDPAGSFTVTIRKGRPVAASLDNVPVPTTRILSSRDSIRFLAPSGVVVLALAFDPQVGRIEWAARPQSCRGQASTCVRY
jgi:hypothetical protein